MARRATAARTTPLHVVRPKAAADAPLLTLGQGVELYHALQVDLKDLDKYAGELRREILDTMNQLNVDQVSSAQVEAIRQLRQGRPRLDVERAEKLLRKYHRLDEALVQMLDEDKAWSIIDELHERGLISDADIPYEETAETEALIVRSK